MGIPERDLVIGFTGGNYSDAAAFTSQRVFVPQYLVARREIERVKTALQSWRSGRAGALAHG